MPMEQLDTPRLCLRPWREDDRPAFAAINGDPEVMRYFPDVLTRAQSDALAEQLQERMQAQGGWGFWAAEERSSGQVIGFIGLNSPAIALPIRSATDPLVEIGWRLARSHWGLGLASEGARSTLDFAFERLQLPEVVAFTALPNLRSAAVMQRLGMQRDPQDFDHPALPPGHWLRRHCLYRLQRAQQASTYKAAPSC